MKRIVFFLGILLMAGNVWAQKYAVVDSEKILEALPEYTVAQEQISKLQEQYTQKLQKEYDLLEHMFQKYQNDKNTLNSQQRKIREQQIIDREKEVKELQEQYFGQEGAMAKASMAIFQPVQDKLQQAINYVAQVHGYSLVLDVSSGMGIVHYASVIDISNLVIERLHLVK
ncbi:MAG: OmpH family outer membrane protein [Bacteroidales bacterium]|jgi:outer membrane protein|nr:OmpH family outer membrane protein [Bacteroidales bacterium]HHV41181.1 OmpH family outer membrane protein [Bacteroidales bacterium]